MSKTPGPKVVEGPYYLFWLGRRPHPPLLARQTVASSTRQNHDGPKPARRQGVEEEKGAMARRLEQMSHDSLESSPRSAQKVVEEAGFSEDLRRQLEERIAGAKFKSEHASAIALSRLPSGAGARTRDIAGARPWTGTEAIEDTALRMLTDAHKPLRGPSKIPTPIIRLPSKVDTGRSQSGAVAGDRLATARDRSTMYAALKEAGLSEIEREQFAREMKERFSPGARTMPATMRGLENLANQRIEDAIARGQFKNLPRGQQLERDYQASSPFLDTTEYLLNKVIKKQDIVPPWIEKQQELVSTSTKFRSRLRNDWKRHAARMISSQGGTLEDQVRRAEEYAAAEAVDNPPTWKRVRVTTINPDGHVSQISLSGQLTAPDIQPPPSSTAIPARAPFRDPDWERTEFAYHNLTIKALNKLTRSYNLIAPKLARKPYFNLARELKSAYANVAPFLPEEIRERASRPRSSASVGATRPSGILEKFEMAKARVYDEDIEKKGYGLRQFWRDLWRKGPET
ncbi:hypothetical protein EJ06DRAFT_537646 [Trichodelitschia bisporula]|uniref:DnaJ homologue subfamily C member 28 conserved domain-containing protein n=1 Tax=Trichodelitschia bisporula TaxID=703511 RepID=A0A6G1HXX0_9PEZI|nr:hypothetical protein EJ06DRAFT_537646 [Trichodelitschia bisporula]